ncbi:MAG TPA: metal-dependent hydrolase [Gemmatimonadaceae bacterium]
MFLGHYGLALAGKRATPRTSLGTLTFAAEFLDELWPILLLLGIERVAIDPTRSKVSPLDFIYYPYSHSLLMSIVWGALIGVAYYLLTKYPRGALVVGLMVVSHWILDLPMHMGDLPLWPGASSPKVGWGWWSYLPLTYIVEFTIYFAGVYVYARATRPRDRIGRWGLWAYVVVLAVLYLASNGPPPATVRALAWTTLLIWLFIPWAWWIDKHRYYAGRITSNTGR